MKKALIITYYWPPSGGAGVQRWLKFTKYMREFGWEPVIYTPVNPEYPAYDASLEKDIPAGVEVINRPIWEPFDLYKRFVGMKKEDRLAAGFLSEKKKPSRMQNLMVWIRGNFFIPDARRFWIRPSVRYLKRYLRSNPVDVLISTGPPHSMHLIAMALKKDTGLPWLADFRDPWTRIDFYHELRLSGWADRRHHQLERRVLSTADRVVVIGEGMRKDFFGLFEREYQVITNGFDEADFEQNERFYKGDTFSIAHIGSMNRDRNPEMLWRVLGQMVKEMPEFAEQLRIELIGKTDFQVIQSIEIHDLQHNLRLVDYLPHHEAVRWQRTAAVLLLVINRTPTAGMILTGKFFEYLSSGRPILCVGPAQGDAKDIIESTSSGISIPYESEERTRRAIEMLWQRYQNRELQVTAANTAIYSRRNLTGVLSRVLEGMMG